MNQRNRIDKCRLGIDELDDLTKRWSQALEADQTRVELSDGKQVERVLLRRALENAWGRNVPLGLGELVGADLDADDVRNSLAAQQLLIEPTALVTRAWFLRAQSLTAEVWTGYDQTAFREPQRFIKPIGTENSGRRLYATMLATVYQARQALPHSVPLTKPVLRRSSPVEQELADVTALSETISPHLLPTLLQRYGFGHRYRDISSTSQEILTREIINGRRSRLKTPLRTLRNNVVVVSGVSCGAPLVDWIAETASRVFAGLFGAAAMVPTPLSPIELITEMSHFAAGMVVAESNPLGLLAVLGGSYYAAHRESKWEFERGQSADQELARRRDIAGGRVPLERVSGRFAGLAAAQALTARRATLGADAMTLRADHADHIGPAGLEARTVDVATADAAPEPPTGALIIPRSTRRSTPSEGIDGGFTR